MKLKLLKKRTVWLPTWRGWIVLCLVTVSIVVAGARSVHPFLAVSAPVPANTLVVDGWLPDNALEAAIVEYRRGRYETLCAAGGPLRQGRYLSEHRNFAELSAASLRAMGVDDTRLVVAPSADVPRNRTFASARAVKNALNRQGVSVDGMNLVTMGLHARRSRMVYQKVFGPDTRVGVISCPSENYDPARWWDASAGLKGVIGESLALACEWLFDSGRAAGTSVPVSEPARTTDDADGHG